MNRMLGRTRCPVKAQLVSVQGGHVRGHPLVPSTGGTDQPEPRLLPVTYGSVGRRASQPARQPRCWAAHEACSAAYTPPARTRSRCGPRSTIRPAVDDDDLVGGLGGREPVGDGDRGAPAGQARRGPAGGAPRWTGRPRRWPRRGRAGRGRRGRRGPAPRAGAPPPTATRPRWPTSVASPWGSPASQASRPSSVSARRDVLVGRVGAAEPDVLQQRRVEEEALLRAPARRARAARRSASRAGRRRRCARCPRWGPSAGSAAWRAWTCPSRSRPTMATRELRARSRG